jgi:hypothetical protein
VEITELFSTLSFAAQAFIVLIVTAVLLILARTFLICGVLFRAPRMREKFLKFGRSSYRWMGCGLSLLPTFAPHQLRAGAGVPILLGAGGIDHKISAQ